jgi:DNA-binding MarR family transcriptional regulator
MKPRRNPHFYDGVSYPIADGVGYLMKRIAATMARLIERRMADHGLTAAQWAPLWMIEAGKSDTAQGLTCAMGIDGGAMTRMLDRLVAKGLVERERSTDDRRVVRLRITEAGREVVRHVPFVLAEANNLALRGFTTAEFDQLKSMLKRIHATVSEEERNA